jgi:Domain of unknown function (DUF6378)
MSCGHNWRLSTDCPYCVRDARIAEVVEQLQALDTPPARQNLDKAWTLTHGERRSAYGSAAQVFAGYALMWTALLAKKLQPGVSLDAADVTLMMTALKLAREANAPATDNMVDAHGYLILHDEVLSEGR